MAGSVLSVNIAEPRTLERRGRQVRTGIWKRQAEGPVAVGPEGLDGDLIGDLKFHGGVDKAVYAYAREDIDWWEGELGRALPDGTFGENLTLRGVDVTGAAPGERWEAGGVVLEVTEPRTPCWKLQTKMGEPGFIKRFAQAGRPGMYLRVLEPGQVAAGDALRVL